MDDKTLRVLNDPCAELFLCAGQTLLSMLVKDEHPNIKELPWQIKTELLAGRGWLLERDLVTRYANKTLDEKNSFLLKHGEIRVFGAEEVVLKFD